MISAMKKMDNGNLELTITVDRKTVKSAYQKTLKELAAKTEIKGFRKGKAPVKMVEENLGKNKIQLKTYIPMI